MARDSRGCAMFWLYWRRVRRQSPVDLRAARRVVKLEKGDHVFVFAFDPRLQARALKLPGEMVVATGGLFSWGDAAEVCAAIRSMDCEAMERADATGV